MKTERKEYYEFKFQDLDEFATEVYGQRYSSLDWIKDSIRNDMYTTFDVNPVKLMGNPEDETGDWNEDFTVWTPTGSLMEKWLSNAPDKRGDVEDSPYVGHILNDLCFRGLIPPGNYLMEICW